MLGSLGVGDSRRKKGKEYIARNVTPLMETTRRFMDGEMSELQVMEQLAREDADGWSVAGAKDAWTHASGELNNALLGGSGGGGVGTGAGAGAGAGVGPEGGGVGGGGSLGGGGSSSSSDSVAGGGKGGGAGGKLTAAQAEKVAVEKAAAEKAAADSAAAAAAAASRVHSDPSVLYREFKHFRDNCDLLNIRKHADMDSMFFSLMLSDLERKAAANERDVRQEETASTPLHSTHSFVRVPLYTTVCS